MCVSVCICVAGETGRMKEKRVGKEGVGEMIQEASKATAEQSSERCIRPMFIS